MREAREEYRKGNVRQATEKVWEATALTVKAYAYWKEGNGWRVTGSSGTT